MCEDVWTNVKGNDVKVKRSDHDVTMHAAVSLASYLLLQIMLNNLCIIRTASDNSCDGGLGMRLPFRPCMHIACCHMSP